MKIKSKEEMKMEYRSTLFGIQEDEPQVFEEDGGPMADGSGEGDPDGEAEQIQREPEIDYDKHEIHPNYVSFHGDNQFLKFIEEMKISKKPANPMKNNHFKLKGAFERNLLMMAVITNN